MAELSRKHRVIKAVQVKQDSAPLRLPGTALPMQYCWTDSRAVCTAAQAAHSMEIGASREPLWTDHPGGRPHAGKDRQGHSSCTADTVDVASGVEARPGRKKNPRDCARYSPPFQAVFERVSSVSRPSAAADGHLPGYKCPPEGGRYGA